VISNKPNKNNIINSFILLSFYIYLFTFIYKYQAGILQNSWLFFHDKTDRFGDTLKIIYSFSSIFSESELITLKVPESWIYKNPYNKPFTEGTTLVMSLPPLTIIFLVISAHFAKLIGVNYLFIFFILTGVLLVIFSKLFFKDFKYNKKIIFILFSFPLLFLLERANMMAAISGICLFLIFKKFWLGLDFNNLDILLFIIACSLRPNYLVFGLIFLFKDNLLLIIVNFLKIGFSYLAFNGILFFLAPLFLENYSFSNFILLIDYYANSNIRYDPWNSSLYNSIYNLYMYRFAEEFVLYRNLEYVIMFFYSSIILFSFFRSKLNKISQKSFLIISAAGCALMTSPFADYHLIIFIFLNLLLVSKTETKDFNNLNLVLLLIILLPKFHSYSPNINISNIINVITLNLLIFQNLKSNVETQKILLKFLKHS